MMMDKGQVENTRFPNINCVKEKVETEQELEKLHVQRVGQKEHGVKCPDGLGDLEKVIKIQGASSPMGVHGAGLGTLDSVLSKERKNGLRILYLNARSVRNKADELEAQMNMGNYDIVGITETWLQGDQAWELSVPGYTCYRRDRNMGRGGGVALLVRNEIQSLARGDLGSGEVESVWIELRNSKGKKTLMGIVYRPPNSSMDIGYNLIRELSLACAKGNVVVMGDFNMQVNWENQVGAGPQDREFVECLRDVFLEQLVLEPTRNEAILDLVMCNEQELISDLEVKEPLGSGDHNMISFYLQFERDKGRSEVSVLQLNKGDYGAMRDELAKVKWAEILAGKTVDQQWQIFLGIILKMQNQFIPLRRKDSKRGKGPQWLTKEVRNCIALKKKKYDRAKISGNTDDWESYKEQQILTKKAIRRDKIRYELSLARNIKGDSKSFFSYVKRKKIVKNNVGPLKNELGEFVMGNREMATEFNAFFRSVFTREDTGNLPDVWMGQGHKISEKLEQIDIRKVTVMSRLMGLKANKSPGPDGLHPRVLKEVAQEIADALVIIFQCSLDSGSVPEDWRVANVIPIFKKGGKEKTENYRPVSLTSVVGKMLESIIKDEMVAYLDGSNRIRPSQHGFTKGKSCLTNLLEFFESVTRMLDEGKPVDVVYLDFQKAFDKVPHRRLVSKIRAHGIGGRVLTWIEN